MVFDGDVGYHVAQKEASGVAHEGFPVPCLAEHVEEEEHEDATREAGANQIEELCVEVEIEHGERPENHHGERGGESVDAVDEVDGIHDEQNDEHGDRIACPQGDGMDPEEAVEVVYLQVAQWHEQCSDGLNHEFGTCVHAFEVVDEANDVDHYCTQNHKHGGCAQLDFAVAVAHLKADEESNHHGWQKHHAAQSWNGLLVDLASVGLVVEVIDFAVADDERDGKQRHECGGCECYDYVEVFSHILLYSECCLCTRTMLQAQFSLDFFNLYVFFKTKLNPFYCMFAVLKSVFSPKEWKNGGK